MDSHSFDQTPIQGDELSPDLRKLLPEAIELNRFPIHLQPRLRNYSTRF